MDNLQPYNGNPSLIDLTCHSSCTTSYTHMTSFTPVPYSSQNALTSSPSATKVSRMDSSAWALSSNSNVSLPNVSRIANDYVMNPNLNIPTITNTSSQSPTKNGSFTYNDLNKKQLTDLPTNQTLVELNHQKTIKETISVSNNGVQVNASKREQRISIETAVEDYSSYDLNGKELSCQICDINFWTEELLTTHLEGNKFNCRVCTAEFINHSELKSHFLSHRTYRCIICKKAFLSKEDLFSHRKSSLSCTPKFECDICMKMLLSKESVRKHKQCVHQTGSKLYSCVVCNKMFVLPFKLNAHLSNSHVAYENLKCKECGLMFLGPKKLKRHTKVSHLSRRETCPFTCSFCGKVFYFKSALAKHEETHGQAKEMVVCEICGKYYKGAKGLNDHVKHYHNNIIKSKCTKCNMGFRSTSLLGVHLRNVHHEKSNIIPAICEICGKTLKNKQQLQSHLLTHSSERRFKCDTCSATFKQLVALRTHSRIHTGVCKYNCNNCGKSFRWKQTFDKHVNKCKTTQS